MKTVVAYPPNIEAIRKVFTFTRRVIFCYGDTIYNPDNVWIDRPMIVHEEVHMKQQAEIGIEEWWDRYLADPVFRVEQEKPAYRAQYIDAKKYIKRIEKLNLYAIALAEALSGDTYGHCIGSKEALLFITSHE